MINNQYKQRLQETYLNEFEREILKDINTEQDNFFKPIENLNINGGYF